MRDSLHFDELALALQIPDALADAARLLAVDALAAEGAARRGECETFVEWMRRAAAALDDIREIFAIGRFGNE